MVSNALASQSRPVVNRNPSQGINPPQVTSKGRPFLGQPRPQQCSMGIDGHKDPNQSCNYCKDTGHLIGNCLRLQAKRDRERVVASAAAGLRSITTQTQMSN